jgi:hypothetical protein
MTWSQNGNVTLSGKINDDTLKEPLAYVNVILKKDNPDKTFVSGVITNEEGIYTLENINPGNYILEVFYIGYKTHLDTIFVGSNSQYLDLGVIFLKEEASQLDEVLITAKKDAVSSKMDKKTFSVMPTLPKVEVLFYRP